MEFSRVLIRAVVRLGLAQAFDRLAGAGDVALGLAVGPQAGPALLAEDAEVRAELLDEVFGDLEAHGSGYGKVRFEVACLGVRVSGPAIRSWLRLPIHASSFSGSSVERRGGEEGGSTSRIVW